MNSGSTQLLNLIIGIVLGRLLSPEDYGIVGVLTIFTLIAGDLQSAGFTQGLINIKKPVANDYNSVFTFNIGMSVIMYTVLFFAAPFIADYFHEECLVAVSRVVFLTFLISSLGIAHGGYMAKNMMNKEIAVISALALISSGTTGITLAFLGYSYWSLAWQQVMYITVLNIGRYVCVRAWRPRITTNLTPVRQMAPFAVKILATKILNTLSNNILTVIFGRLFPMHAVGNYSQAYKWNTMASSLLSNTVGQIAQPVLVEAFPKSSQGGEQNRQLVVFRKMIRFTAFLSMPLMFGLSLVGWEFIAITIGENWMGCVPMLQALCISGAFMPLYTMYQNLAISHGRSDIFMWLNIGQIAGQVALVVLLHSWSMQAMVEAYSLFLILWLLPWHAFTGRLIGYRWTDAFKDVAPFTIAAGVVMVCVYYLTASIGNDVLLIAVRIVLAAVLYYCLMKVARVRILNECEQFLVRKMKK